MRWIHAGVVWVVVLACLAAAPPDNPFPKPPPSPAPAPTPAPAGTVLNLTSDVFYVFSDANADLLAVPEGLVKVSKTPGPITFKGKFIDSGGAIETRTIPGPFVYSVDAIPGAKGRVHLLLVREGRKVGDPVPTSAVDVNGGDGPRPPPVPPDPPVPPVDPLLASVQALYTADTSTTKATDKTSLAAVYVATANALGSVNTAADLFAVIKGATETRIAGRLKSIRSVFGAELEKFLPTDATAVLTAAQKTEAVKQLNRFSTVLGGVK